ncbi:hypothetical protein BT63DRAFT_420103 [Microthyrium microscopicum]|uniref:Early meiotic induction protein 1 n=1 Tax=Microthyrium microscopicum TaxID=703497 RepID=A0A6A6URD9_9PEZI|nr:hypothetical protein BT63DRAFT_420103 [Microthyrium microscopicum]
MALSRFWSSTPKPEANSNPTPEPQTTSSSNSEPPSSSASLNSSTQNRPSTTAKSKSTMEESIAKMPDTMNCVQAFDIAMACRGPAGTFKSVYRYGHWRDCSQQWSDWFFCMRIRVQPEANKRQMIQQRYWEKEERFRAAPNSEDVWEERTEQVKSFIDKDPDKDGLFEGLWAKSPPERDEKI